MADDLPDRSDIVRRGCISWLPHGAKPHSMAEELAALAQHAPGQPDAKRYGANPYAVAFEAEVAELLGQPAALFMPSGTMAQPIALRVWADELDMPRVAFHPTCHLELHEHRAYAELHGLQAVLVGDADRLMTLADLKAVTQPLSTLLIELPQREIGGQLPSWEDLTEVVAWAKGQGIRTHLDGARLWEAAPFYQRPVAEIAALFDSVYVSFYKTLGAIAGALLAGPEAFIAEAKIWLRRQGGNVVYQYPYIVSCERGLRERLPQVPTYVERARKVAAVFNSVDGVSTVPDVPQTNMFHVFLEGDKDRLQKAALDIAEETGVWLLGRLQPTEGTRCKCEVVLGPSSLDVTGVALEGIAAMLRDLMLRARGT